MRVRPPRATRCPSATASESVSVQASSAECIPRRHLFRPHLRDPARVRPAPGGQLAGYAHVPAIRHTGRLIDRLPGRTAARHRSGRRQRRKQHRPLPRRACRDVSRRRPGNRNKSQPRRHDKRTKGGEDHRDFQSWTTVKTHPKFSSPLCFLPDRQKNPTGFFAGPHARNIGRPGRSN